MRTHSSRLCLSCIVAAAVSCLGFSPAQSQAPARGFASESSLLGASSPVAALSHGREAAGAVATAGVRPMHPICDRPEGMGLYLSQTELTIASGGSGTLTSLPCGLGFDLTTKWTSSSPLVTVKPVDARGEQATLKAGNGTGDAVITASIEKVDKTYTASATIRVRTADAWGFVFDGSGDLLAYNGAAKDVRIPAGVTSIHKNAFLGSNVERIHVPASVTSIGDSAFANAKKLTTVTFEDTDANPSRLTSIGSRLIEGDSNFVSMKLPRSLTKIPASAFANTGAKEISLPSGVTDIPEGAFADSPRLTKVKLSDGVTRIGPRAFESDRALSAFARIGSGEKELGAGLPSKLAEIKENAFASSGIRDVSLPSSVTSIDNGVWRWSKLKKITLNEGLKRLGSYAFGDSEVEDLTIPDSVQTVGFHAFVDMPSLKRVRIGDNVGAGLLPKAFKDTPKLAEIQVKNSSVNYASVEGVLFDKRKTKLIAFPFMRKYGFSTYKVPEGVTEITAYAFEKVKITKVTFPATLKHIREYAFAETALTNLTLPNSFETIENHAFFNISSLKSLDLGGTINVGYSAFYYADHLTQVNLRPDLGRLAKIESSGFQAVPLTTITIPDSVTELGYFAFGGNKKLTKVHIGAGVRIFDLGAFDDGDAFGQFPLTLRELTVSAANPVYSADHNTLYAKRDDGLHLIRSYNSATASEYSVRKGTVQIAEKAFSGHKKLVKIILPEGLKRVGQQAFYRSNSLVNVNFPESLEYVDGYISSFFREVEFGTHIREIAYNSFFDGMPERIIVRGGINGKFTDSSASLDKPGKQKSAYFGEGMTNVVYENGDLPKIMVLPSTLKEFRLRPWTTDLSMKDVYIAAAPGTAAWNLVSGQMSKIGMDPARQLHSYTPLKAVLRNADKLVRGSKSPVTVEVSGGVEGRRQARILAVSPNGKTSVLHDWTDASQLPSATASARTTAVNGGRAAIARKASLKLADGPTAPSGAASPSNAVSPSDTAAPSGTSSSQASSNPSTPSGSPSGKPTGQSPAPSETPTGGVTQQSPSPSEASPSPSPSSADTPASPQDQGTGDPAYGFTAEITVPADGSSLKLEVRDETGYTVRTDVTGVPAPKPSTPNSPTPSAPTPSASPTPTAPRTSAPSPVPTSQPTAQPGPSQQVLPGPSPSSTGRADGPSASGRAAASAGPAAPVQTYAVQGRQAEAKRTASAGRPTERPAREGRLVKSGATVKTMAALAALLLGGGLALRRRARNAN
mgnify:CR=1 FL=1